MLTGDVLSFKVTVHQPICQDNGDLNLALYGSFLPVPSVEKFASASANVVPLVCVALIATISIFPSSNSKFLFITFCTEPVVSVSIWLHGQNLLVLIVD